MPEPPFAKQTLTQFLTGLASKTPAPGGGAIAAITGAQAAALAEMVVAYSIGHPDLAKHDDDLVRARDVFARARDLLLGLADEDADAYAGYSDLRKRAKADPELQGAVDAAKAACLAAPRAVLAAGSDVLRHLETLLGTTNPHLASDLAVAAALAECCVASAAHNVRTNLPFAPDAERLVIDTETASLCEQATDRRARVERFVSEGVPS